MLWYTWLRDAPRSPGYQYGILYTLAGYGLRHPKQHRPKQQSASIAVQCFKGNADDLHQSVSSVLGYGVDDILEGFYPQAGGALWLPTILHSLLAIACL